MIRRYGVTNNVIVSCGSFLRCYVLVAEINRRYFWLAPNLGGRVVGTTQALSFCIRQGRTIRQLSHSTNERHIHFSVRGFDGHDGVMETGISTCCCNWSKVGCPSHVYLSADNRLSSVYSRETDANVVENFKIETKWG